QITPYTINCSFYPSYFDHFASSFRCNIKSGHIRTREREISEAGDEELVREVNWGDESWNGRTQTAKWLK
ncbi:hypothetical protein LINPERPRIM_LOCUS41295, partial [Linum perenne]